VNNTLRLLSILGMALAATSMAGEYPRVEWTEKILYFEEHVVLDPGKTPLTYKQLLTEEQYRKAQEDHGDGFRAGMGAEAIRELLKKLNVPELANQLRARMMKETSQQNRKKITKRLRIVEAFLNSGCCRQARTLSRSFSRGRRR
jgi:DNA-directed RNA polymerase beta' subunit